jgi:high affinity sulfate transporter 1
VAIGRTFAAIKDYHLDGNKEMVALGTMNIVGSMTSCYVTTGSSTHVTEQLAVNYLKSPVLKPIPCISFRFFLTFRS